MNGTDNDIVDFPETRPNLFNIRSTWKACWPVDIIREGTDVVLFVPFQKQQPGNDNVPDMQTPRKYYRMVLRAYDERVLRISISFNGESMAEPPFGSEQDKSQINSLSFSKTKNSWIIKDQSGTVRAIFRFKNSQSIFYNELLPPKNDTIEVSFFPDGVNEIILDARDTSFSGDQHKNEICFTEVNEDIKRSSITLSIPCEKAGERGDNGWFSKNDQYSKDVCITGENIGLFSPANIKKTAFLRCAANSVSFSCRKKILDMILVGGDSKHEIKGEIERFTGATILKKDTFQHQMHQSRIA